MATIGKPDGYDRISSRLAEIEKLAETLTDIQIADMLGIGKTSLARYKRLHADLKEAIDRGHAKRGTKYEKLVQPRLAEITEWRKLRASELVISKMLGISYPAFKEYKQKHEELVEALQVGTDTRNFEISSALVKAAKGYFIEEPGPDGETIRRWIKPDVAAAIALLKSDDPSFHNDDRTTREMKKRALDQTDKRIEQAEYS